MTKEEKEKLIEDLCENYCKHGYGEDLAKLERTCNNCPLNKLNEAIPVWTELTSRMMTDEEKEERGLRPEENVNMINSDLPQDGEEVLITVRGMVEETTFIEEGYGEVGFDDEYIEDVTAWMPMPEPFKKGAKHDRR